MSEHEDIANLLIQTLKSKSPASGADLGPLVKEHYPSADLKTTYGGLHKFINKYCAEEITFLGKRGLDNLYAHKSNEIRAPNFHASNVDAWRAFSNPKIHLQTLVDRESGDIDVASPLQPTVKDGWLPIEKISVEEYRSMAQEFVATLEESEIKNQLQEALTTSDFWPTWSLMINRLRAEGIYRRWLDFRITQIRKIFKERLFELNLSEELCDRAFHSLRASREQVLRQKSVREATKKDQSSSRPKSDFREIILEAMKHLTDDDLRRIWLPAGVLIDALKGNR